MHYDIFKCPRLLNEKTMLAIITCPNKNVTQHAHIHIWCMHRKFIRHLRNLGGALKKKSRTEDRKFSPSTLL